MKRAVLYMRVSTADQTTDNQAHDLKQIAQHRGLKSSTSTSITASVALAPAVQASTA